MSSEGLSAEENNAINELGKTLGGINLGNLNAASENEGASATNAETLAAPNSGDEDADEYSAKEEAEAEEAAAPEPEPAAAAAAAAAPVKSAGVKTASEIQRLVAEDINARMNREAKFNEKQKMALSKIPTEIRAPLASLYQKDRARYEKLASRYIKKVGGYLIKNKTHIKPSVVDQKAMLGIETSEQTKRRKLMKEKQEEYTKSVAAAAAPVAAPATKTKKSKKSLLTNNTSVESKATTKTATRATAPPSEKKVIKTALSESLGFEAPEAFVKKYMETLQKYEGKTKKVPTNKFVKYCGLFANRKTRKNKGASRGAAASAANTNLSI
jgi:hypothetical protein